LYRTTTEIATAAALAATAHAARVAAAAHAAHVAAAQAALTTWNETITAYTSAKDALKALTDARAQEIKAIGDQLTASGHLNNVFDMNAYTTSTDRAKTARLGLADAEKAVRDARSNVGKAKTPEELNGAIKAEEQANKALAASRAEVAAADKAKAAAVLTPKNLLTSIKSKLSNIKSFYNDLVALRKRKLPMSLIRQLIDAGPIEGDQLAKALLSATPSDFNAIINAEAQLDKIGAQIGQIVGDYDYNGLIARQTGVVNTARANAVAAGKNVVQFKMYLDGREVAVALKAYRASVGGTPLGLG
jgi:predicted  nucleic acid-binding Zn-ribbon protein